VSWMCQKLEVSRSGFYAWAKRAPSEHRRRDEALLRKIAGHFEESNGVYGSPRIHALLRRRGERVGRKRVVRLMRTLHLRARANRIYRPRGSAPVCRLNLANEARCREVTGPDQVWRGDVTYLFFHSLKTEAIHGRSFADAVQLDAAVRRYIERYNRTRIHSSLAYMSPIDYERTNA